MILEGKKELVQEVFQVMCNNNHCYSCRYVDRASDDKDYFCQLRDSQNNIPKDRDWNMEDALRRTNYEI